MRKQQVVLEDEPDRALLGRNVRPGGAVLEHRAVQMDMAAADRDESGQRPQERRLARAVWPEQRHDLSGSDLERDVEVQGTKLQLHRGLQRHAAPSHRSRRPTSTATEIASSTRLRTNEACGSLSSSR